MSLILLWIFRLRVHNCTVALAQVVPLQPLTKEERVHICTVLVTNQERTNETINHANATN